MIDGMLDIKEKLEEIKKEVPRAFFNGETVHKMIDDLINDIDVFQKGPGEGFYPRSAYGYLSRFSGGSLAERRSIVGKNMEYIPEWQKKKLICSNCGTDKSVKYSFNGKNYCNLCIIKASDK